MEDLTKTQIVLLCLLLSFVVSIGTGIITFSLLSEVPQAVTQTINRVVERTIEKVVPSPSKENTVTKETTVVVKEEDLIIDAINKNTNSIVRIKLDADNSFYGLGLIVTKEGLVVADEKNFSPIATYYAVMSDGKKYKLSALAQKKELDVRFFEIKKDKDDTSVFSSAILGNSESLQLGQSVIGISGIESTSIATGRVTGLKRVDAVNSTPSYVSLIETDVTLKDSALGGPLLNLSGQVVGLNVSNVFGIQNRNFIPIGLIKTAISVATSEK